MNDAQLTRMIERAVKWFTSNATIRREETFLVGVLRLC